MAKKKRVVRKPASTPLESTLIASEHSPVGEEEPVEEIYHEPSRMIKSVPVWIRLNGLGLQYWGKTNLSALASWETPTDRRGLEGIMQKLHRISILRAEKGVKFHAKLFYNLQVEAQEVKYSRAIWNKLIIPKHRFILWQACNVQLLTRDHLSKFLIIPSILCPVCENDIETHTHLFFDCVFPRKTFVEIGKWLGVVDWPKEAEQIQQWCTRGPLDFKNRVINSVFAASLYLLWKNRNSCIFDLVCSSPLKLSMEIRKLSHYRILSLTCNTSKKQDKYKLM
ncbi:hypothetical protein G4B88_003414 [Cannabis sativa]|uniref:Reverse transcriptase zinc-binding domain-containing protein n=1 Tax=Cannabis sativa TaxID=3483 RepID=A0A7J6H4R4_CANSA|nr:hypothetical protein G4B88_003414 [Cannabis sativa]